jgi:hypothetical protein
VSGITRSGSDPFISDKEEDFPCYVDNKDFFCRGTKTRVSHMVMFDWRTIEGGRSN